MNDRLHARRGSRFLALTSGGTIPDAGLYDVYVAETDLKVGTLDEEFVTESLPGDVFLLGSHAWKIAKVRADRVLVEDAQRHVADDPVLEGRAPVALVGPGRGRRPAAPRRRRSRWTRRTSPSGRRASAAATRGAAAAMHAWLVKAGEVLDGVPDDQGIVVESFSDEMGGRHAMIHSVFGMRINGAWGMALHEQVRRALRPAGRGQPRGRRHPPVVRAGPGPAVAGAAGHAGGPGGGRPAAGRGADRLAAVRHALPPRAVRALFIPRMTRGQRTPAYLQRLKADALLESVRGQPDFPVVAETLRECFNDAYDVPRLKRLLERLHDREMWVRHVDTPLPSPFVYPLLLAWDWAYLDAGHAEERRSDAVVMRKAWSVAPGPLRPEIVAAVEAELQKTAPERRARDANELAALLDDLGDLTRRGDRRARRRRRRGADGRRCSPSGGSRRWSSPAADARGSPPPTPRSTPGSRPTPASSAWRCACSAPGAR